MGQQPGPTVRVLPGPRSPRGWLGSTCVPLCGHSIALATGQSHVPWEGPEQGPAVSTDIRPRPAQDGDPRRLKGRGCRQEAAATLGGQGRVALARRLSREQP